jgi:hypothetical protein
VGEKIRLAVGYWVGFSIGIAIQTGVLGAVLYHLNKLVMWIELGSNGMTLSQAFGLAFIVVILVEILARLTGRK